MKEICKKCCHYDEMLTLRGMPGVPCWMGQDPAFVENDDCQYFEVAQHPLQLDAKRSLPASDNSSQPTPAPLAE